MNLKMHVVCSLIQLADSGIFFLCNGTMGIMLLTSMLQSDLRRASPSGELLKSAGFLYGTR